MSSIFGVGIGASPATLLTGAGGNPITILLSGALGPVPTPGIYFQSSFSGGPNITFQPSLTEGLLANIYAQHFGASPAIQKITGLILPNTCNGPQSKYHDPYVSALFAHYSRGLWGEVVAINIGGYLFSGILANLDLDSGLGIIEKDVPITRYTLSYYVLPIT